LDYFELVRILDRVDRKPGEQPQAGSAIGFAPAKMHYASAIQAPAAVAPGAIMMEQYKPH
jgi:hypothetical protein